MCDSAGGCGDCGGGDAAGPPAQQQPRSKRRPACMRCKEQPAVVVVRHRDPLCAACASHVALAKVRGALRLKVGLAAGDSVLLCLSGGHCSRALLELLREVQSLDRSRPGRSKIAFDLAVAHIEEGAAAGIPAEASDARAAAVWASVSGALAPEQFVCLRLEDVYLEGQAQGPEAPGSRDARRARLHALIQAVPDTTGREDLVKALREALLLREARRRGASHLARGDCADRLAARAVACAAKGAGYALPASLHFLDARHGPGAPVWISPARELMAKDLAIEAHLRRLRTVPPAPLPALARQASINALAERFVAGLALGTPSAAHTILATAGKLRPFDWNTRAGLAGGGGGGGNVLCAVCSAPMEPADASQEQAQPQPVAAACCRSCRQQLLGLSASGGGAEQPELDPAFLRLAPPLVAARLGAQPGARPVPVPREQLRAQLADCLLEDD